MASTVFTIECASPVADNFFQLQDLVEYLNKHIKVAGLRSNHHDKITIEKNDSNKAVSVTATIKLSKRAIRYYVRKFLKKNDIRDRFRAIANTKTSIELRPYRVSSNE